MAVISITFGELRRLIGLPKSYADLIEMARQVFKTGNAELLIYITMDTAEEFELDPSAYEVVSNGCSLRLVEKRHTSSECDTEREQPVYVRFEPEPEESLYVSPESEPDVEFSITVKMLTGRIDRHWVTPHMTIAELKEKVEDVVGVPPEFQRISFNRLPLEDKRPLSSYSITSDSEIWVFTTLRGGKPAIYLLSPVQLSNASVCVTLSHHWEFSIIYPLAQPALGSGEQSSVSWQVSADPNETLKDTATGAECSYLYWEATTTRSPYISSECPFNLQSPSLSREGSNACILPFSDFVPYLDRTLKKLTLSPAVRTECIVYWLPKFQGIRDRGLDIAFDFVHQVAFQKVAKLCPKTVARIFLLFDGVPKDVGEDLSRAELDAIDWPARIGMDADGVRDEGAFRVLKWGGMEARAL